MKGKCSNIVFLSIVKEIGKIKEITIFLTMLLFLQGRMSVVILELKLIFPSSLNSIILGNNYYSKIFKSDVN